VEEGKERKTGLLPELSVGHENRFSRVRSRCLRFRFMLQRRCKANASVVLCRKPAPQQGARSPEIGSYPLAGLRTLNRRNFGEPHRRRGAPHCENRKIYFSARTPRQTRQNSLTQVPELDLSVALAAPCLAWQASKPALIEEGGCCRSGNYGCAEEDEF
jgi:hypothetical protein